MTELAGKQVLVTGATGFLGSALTLRLAQEGVCVKALARRPEKARFLNGKENIEVLMGDINDEARMHEVMRGCEYVFHVAAALGGSLKQQRQVNRDGTRTVMLAAATAQVKRVIQVSSIAVYGYNCPIEVSEETALHPGSVPYNITKAEAEEMVREVAAAKGISYSIIRPGMIYGPRSNAWTAVLFRLGKRKPTPFLGDGSGTTHPIFVDDVVSLMIVSATHPDADKQAFNCTPDPAPSWRTLVGEYSKLAGHNRWLALPILPVKMLAPLIEWVLTLRGEPQEVPLLLPFLQSSRTYQMTKARTLLNWQPQISLQEGIDRCAPWLREKGLLA